MTSLFTSSPKYYYIQGAAHVSLGNVNLRYATKTISFVPEMVSSRYLCAYSYPIESTSILLISSIALIVFRGYILREYIYGMVIVFFLTIER